MGRTGQRQAARGRERLPTQATSGFAACPHARRMPRREARRTKLGHPRRPLQAEPCFRQCRGPERRCKRQARLRERGQTCAQAVPMGRVPRHYQQRHRGGRIVWALLPSQRLRPCPPLCQGTLSRAFSALPPACRTGCSSSRPWQPIQPHLGFARRSSVCGKRRPLGSAPHKRTARKPLGKARFLLFSNHTVQTAARSQNVRERHIR